MAIQPLPTDVIHRIAAGEVIDSLAAVVRELAENSIDAGADRLTVQVWPESWRVRLSDNGRGMDPVDLQRAASPHSTSKIRSDRDLWQLKTLGFRGEALHSLAQLGRLDICSRSATEPEGWRVSYTTQGDVAHQEAVAIAPGTLVTVSDLFAAWPARRQALPSPAQQLRAIQLTIYQIALAHPQITWQVEHSDRCWFTLWPGDSVLDLLPQMVRGLQPSDLRQLVLPAGPALTLTLGLPDRCHRRRPDWVKVLVQGRWVKLPELDHTILASLRPMLPRDRFPIAIVHLHPAPDQVDWNRHPAKTEIFLRGLDQWQVQIQTAIAEILRFTPETLPLGSQNRRLQTLIQAAEAQAPYRLEALSPPRLDPLSDRLPSDPPPLGSNIPTLLPLKAIAQVHHTYIVVEHPAGLWLIEQHIAHERVLYEQLLTTWRCVELTSPLTLAQLSTAQVEHLQQLGVAIEPFGDQVWVVRRVPAPLAERQDCAEALRELSQSGDLNTAQVAIACRSAIRNGTPLCLDQMQTLVEQWQQTKNPHTCPHGRPIYMVLEESQLARFFRRHWVIGKSHGI